METQKQKGSLPLPPTLANLTSRRFGRSYIIFELFLLRIKTQPSFRTTNHQHFLHKLCRHKNNQQFYAISG